MSQSAAPRDEPSMEDILSSIRRIIQSNDEGAEAAQLVTDTPEPAHQDVEVQAEVVDQVAEIAQPEPAAEIIQSEPAVEVVAANPEVGVDTTNEGELTAAPERVRQVVETEEAVFEPEIVEVKADLYNIEPSEQVEPDDAQNPNDAQSKDNGQNTAPALISAGPEAKVVASFAQLNDAITASSARSLEEMTNDMLQPMLQEWLDNNLPSLVERLVREEIERVARGGHEC